MESQYDSYSGKPTAYLDHNIIDSLVKNRSSLSLSELKENYQVIYSDENLKEIKRSRDGGSQHLDVLESLEAMHLKILVTNNYQITDQAIIIKSNPFVDFESYCNNVEPVHEAMEKATAQSLLKFYGGRVGSDF
ncbi:hypothetical protein [Aeromonas caviae]|uniref:hypothetical protein n=1 Tax=Aeromonas caviae TaxID=648 RepID=UPI003F7450C2